MRKLPRPTEDPGSVFELCISKVLNPALKTKLTSVEPDVINASQAYDAAALASGLHAFPRTGNVAGVVTRQEMIAVYVGRMVPKTQPGRVIYDKLVMIPPLGRCPLCDVGIVTTLDHHLPKSEYPVLSVTPTNLVPSCTWCQGSKNESYPQTAEEQTLHPYFDDFEADVWLRAIVVQGSPPSFDFSVDPPNEWDQTRVSRARHHMKTFELRKLYASNAGTEIAAIQQRLARLYDAGGVESVRSHLVAEAESRVALAKNSWQAAMYSAAAVSDWFCNGGFAQS